MKIFNTLTRRKEEFVPLEEGKVKMYVCGPTVYNLIHIGNARPMIIFDTVRRYMEYKGYEVNYVSNFTDVDDKIIKKAIEEGVSAEEISTRYIKECKKDMADMNVKPATTAPQATQEIQGMIDMIQTLIDKGYAYPAADGTVYFRVKKFKEYGKLSHKNLDDLQSGFRSLKVSGEDQKEDPLDFVLWKPKKEGEPSWPSPWCDGRPGWHIECSVMSKKYLGEEIDIHAGGEDLIFPHHENEIAQSECCNGKIFARYWMHNGFLNIDNRKMSKSLGNFRTVRQIGEQYDLQVLRFFMLNAHYRSPLNFSADLMEAAKNSLERILEAAGKLSDRKDNGAAENITEEELALLKEAEGFVTKFEAAMDDDFNTADALAAIFELVKFANTNVDENSSREFAGGLYEELFKLSDVLGLKIEKKEEILDKEIEDLIQERQAARKAKDFKRADEIRDELLKKGIILKDTREKYFITTKKNPRCLTEIRQQGFFIRSSDRCDHFYLAENVLWQCLDCNTGTCRFIYEIFGIYFIKCRKIVHICKEAYCLDRILIAGTGSFQNCSEILHNTVSLLLDGCANYLSSCRIHRDLTGCVKCISMDDSLGVWSDCCRCFVCMYCLHNRIPLS